MREPALGGADESRRDLGPSLARVGPDHRFSQGLVRGREVDERREELARGDLAPRHHLRNLRRDRSGQRLSRAGRLDGEIHLGHGAVRGPQIDSNRVPRLHQDSSTSAGAITVGSPDACGIRTSVAFQPWWRRTPEKGGCPTTLPVKRTACGSKSAIAVKGSPKVFEVQALSPSHKVLATSKLFGSSSPALVGGY